MVGFGGISGVDVAWWATQSPVYVVAFVGMLAAMICTDLEQGGN